MNKILLFPRKYATLEYAFVAIVALQIIIAILHRFDSPLMALTPGEGKLDFHRSYDVPTVQHILNAYGEAGRRIYALDLVADTFYPVLMGLSAILFTLLVIRNRRWQMLLILFPVIFMTADVLENILFLTFLCTFPSLSPTLVGIANLFTRIKLFTISITFFQLYLFVILTTLLFVGRKLKTTALVLARR
jgi:hypothetical protein